MAADILLVSKTPCLNLTQGELFAYRIHASWPSTAMDKSSHRWESFVQNGALTIKMQALTFLSLLHCLTLLLDKTLGGRNRRSCVPFVVSLYSILTYMALGMSFYTHTFGVFTCKTYICKVPVVVQQVHGALLLAFLITPFRATILLGIDAIDKLNS